MQSRSIERLRFPVAIALAIFLVLLAGFVMSGRADYLDVALRDVVLALDPPGAVTAWRVISFLGSGIVITALTVLSVVVLAASSEWWAARQIALVMAIAVILENGLKWLVHRARPAEIFPGTMPSTYSFPSGHALFAFSFYVTIAVIVNRYLNDPAARVALWIVVAFLVLLIGVSRIFLGVHYPTDVLGGYAVAAFGISISRLK